MQDSGGERELVLGNKQLLAIFFVAALLCGVFFAVGYVVGGNSAKAGAAALVADGSSAPASEGKHEEPQPQQQITAETPAVSPPIQAATAAPTDGGGTLPAAEPKVSSNPAAAGAQPATIPAAPVAPAPKPATPAPPAAKPEVQSAKSATTGVFISVPEAATSYWQVHAIGRPTADDLVRALREGGLPAILAESPKPGLYRVLVGPYRSQLTLSDAKKKLTELGYAPIIQKY